MHAGIKRKRSRRTLTHCVAKPIAATEQSCDGTCLDYLSGITVCQPALPDYLDRTKYFDYLAKNRGFHVLMLNIFR